ncbi:MAG: AAA family ATPase, partial [Floccifex porci]|uniref:AAA family ATPase n=1 Tax=Floccifex porci TaxID=2606629 RepID=UPI003F0FD496
TDRIIREVPQRGHIKNFKVTDALRNCFDNVNYFRDFYDWFKTEEDIELRRLRENPHYKNPKLSCVRIALERMIKGYSNLRIELAPARMVMTNSDGIDLQIDQLSGGYKAVLSVIADIAKRLSMANPDSLNPLEEEAVILIDELDLHLHPKWQKEIVDDLKRTFPKCQFIVSTHSPFIIQSLNAEELFDIKTMQFAEEKGNYKGWSIEAIQEYKMGVEPKTSIFNEYLEKFSSALDEENYDEAKALYYKLKEMVNPDSHESKVLKLDMEMMEADDKA